MPILLWGTPGNDRADLSSFCDDFVIFGFAGDDRIFSGSGNDALIGGDDEDQLRGGAGNDELWGGRGPDELATDPEYAGDWLLGEEGNDRLFGGADKDFLDGGRGDDVLIGGRGADVMRGDEGNDTFLFNHNWREGNEPSISDSMPGLQSMDHIEDFISGKDMLLFTGHAAGEDGVNYGEMDVSGDFSTVLSAAAGIIGGGATYAFVADGLNGFLFVDMNGDSVVDLGVMLASLRNTSMFAASDIVLG
jgi:Ca2+-binding RTX toxin-like protein